MAIKIFGKIAGKPKFLIDTVETVEEADKVEEGYAYDLTIETSREVLSDGTRKR